MKRAACTKHKHPSKEGAIIAFKRTGKNVQMNVYYCKPCKAWHLGSSRNPLRVMDRIGQLLEQHRAKHPERTS